MAQIKLSSVAFVDRHVVPAELAVAMFRLAAEVIQKRGMARGRTFEIDGSVCAQGAFMCAATNRPNLQRDDWVLDYDRSETARQRVQAMDRLFEDAMGMSAPMYNDHLAQSAADVAKAFLMIADQLQKEGRIEKVMPQPLPLPAPKVSFSAGSITLTLNDPPASQASHDYVKKVVADHQAKVAGNQSDHELAGGPSA